jgi:hypothetical protein
LLVERHAHSAEGRTHSRLSRPRPPLWRVVQAQRRVRPQSAGKPKARRRADAPRRDRRHQNWGADWTSGELRSFGSARPEPRRAESGNLRLDERPWDRGAGDGRRCRRRGWSRWKRWVQRNTDGWKWQCGRGWPAWGRPPTEDRVRALSQSLASRRVSLEDECQVRARGPKLERGSGVAFGHAVVSRVHTDIEKRQGREIDEDTGVVRECGVGSIRQAG